MTSRAQIVRQVLDEHGRTYAEEAGIMLRDKPAPLFQVLVLTMLCSAPIGADVAARSAKELFDAGWTTVDHMLDSTWQQRVDALGRGGYRRYDESTARHLQDAAELVRDSYRGDLRTLREKADRDPAQIRDLLSEFPRIGPTGVDIFCRQVQGIWPELRPTFDRHVLDGAASAGLPQDPDTLVDLVDAQDLPRLADALVRVDLSSRKDP